jgi:hypothetical protein
MTHINLNGSDPCCQSFLDSEIREDFTIHPLAWTTIPGMKVQKNW